MVIPTFFLDAVVNLLYLVQILHLLMLVVPQFYCFLLCPSSLLYLKNLQQECRDRLETSGTLGVRPQENLYITYNPKQRESKRVILEIGYDPKSTRLL